MLKSILFALLAVAATPTLPGVPLNVTQVGEQVGQCGLKEVVVKVFATPDGKQQARYSFDGRTFAVYIPPIVFALRANGQVSMFNPAETGEEVCETLEKALSKAI